jgi:Rod binding domain-containing protein
LALAVGGGLGLAKTIAAGLSKAASKTSGPITDKGAKGSANSEERITSLRQQYENGASPINRAGRSLPEEF